MFLALFVFVTVLLFWLWWPLGWIGVVASAWCAYFFRDPARVCPSGANWVLSPADGVVSAIGPALPPAEIGLSETPLTRISVFMNVFNVHVNRSPADGEIAAIAYRKGRFFNASLDKASEFNERNALRITTSAGPSIGVVQIAGSGGAAHPLRWEDRRHGLRRTEVRLDSLRQPCRCLSAGGYCAFGQPRPDHGGG